MRRIFATGLAAIFALTLVACGGGDGGTETAESAPAADDTGGAEAAGDETGGGEAAALSMPDWMQVDEAAQTVTMEVVAGQTDANNSWNFNGYSNGDITIVVPVGYTVTIDFSNGDGVSAHSLGIDRSPGGDFPAIFDGPATAFEGAITAGAISLTDATAPGGSESITFVASTAGDYSMVCYVPAHAVSAMWIGFTVSAEGEAGVRM